MIDGALLLEFLWIFSLWKDMINFANLIQFPVDIRIFRHTENLHDSNETHQRVAASVHLSPFPE